MLGGGDQFYRDRVGEVLRDELQFPDPLQPESRRVHGRLGIDGDRVLDFTEFSQPSNPRLLTLGQIPAQSLINFGRENNHPRFIFHFGVRSAEVTGTIHDADGKPVPGAVAQICGSDGKSVKIANADQNGQFDVKGLTPGDTKSSLGKIAAKGSPPMPISASFSRVKPLR